MKAISFARMFSTLKLSIFTILILIYCGNPFNNTPEGTIQLLVKHSKNNNWEAVNKLFLSGYLNDRDIMRLRELFSSDKMTIETKVFTDDSLHSEVIIILNTDGVKKVSAYPLALVLENGSWKIMYTDTILQSFNIDNYKVVDEAGLSYVFANEYKEHGNYKAAINCFKKAIQLRPDVIFAYWGLGITYTKIGEYNEAIEVFKEGLKTDPDNPEMHYNLGNAYSRLKHFDEAIDHFKQAIQLKPDIAHAYGGLGVAYRESGNYKKALESFNQFIRMRPNSVYGYSNRGYTYFDMQQFDKAINDFNKTLELDSQHTDSYAGLAMTYYQMGDKKRAIENYNKAIEIDNRYAGELYKLQKEEIFYTDKQMQIINEILKEIKQKNYQ